MAQTFTDKSGTQFQTPDNKPAVHGTPVKINTPNGQVDGRMNDGRVVPNGNR